MRRARTALAAVALGAALLVGMPTVALAQPGLTAAATPNKGKPGSVTVISGANWSAGARLQVQTCGALAIGGSPTCDLTKTYTTIANKDGAFQLPVQFGRPPVPCPCVVHVSDTEHSGAVDIPVFLVGVAKAPLPKVAATLPTTILSTNVTGWGPVGAWFGAAPQRVAVITVQNTSNQPATNLLLRLSTGGVPGDQLAQRQLAPLAAREARTERVPFTLPAGLGGTYTIRADITGAQPATMTTTARPWGLFLLLAILLVLLIWFVIRRIWRRDRPATGRRHAGRDGQAPAEQTV